VHLMAALVHINNIMNSVRVGVVVAMLVNKFEETKAARQAVWNKIGMVPVGTNVESLMPLNDISTFALVEQILEQLVYLLIVPVLYLGFLHFTATIHNPLGNKAPSYSVTYTHVGLLNGSDSFSHAADNVPVAVSKAKAKNIEMC